jgi:hypothetical protein
MIYASSLTEKREKFTKNMCEMPKIKTKMNFGSKFWFFPMTKHCRGLKLKVLKQIKVSPTNPQI